MPPRPRVLVSLALVLALALPAGRASAAGSSAVAAIQVALQARLLYLGAIDGMTGPDTTAAVKAFQRRNRLPVDGVVGARTRTALGRYGRHGLGSRTLARGAFGWDVAQLQFLLAWHGFSNGTIDGSFGSHVEAALLRFQRWAGLPTVGVVGPATVAALQAPQELTRRDLGGGEFVEHPLPEDLARHVEALDERPPRRAPRGEAAGERVDVRVAELAEGRRRELREPAVRVAEDDRRRPRGDERRQPPLEEPAGGPNFYEFGDDVIYQIKIDNDGDGRYDINYQFRFRTDVANPNTFRIQVGSPLRTTSRANAV